MYSMSTTVWAASQGAPETSETGQPTPDNERGGMLAIKD